MSISGSEAEGFWSPSSKGFSSSCCLAALAAVRASTTRGRVSVKTKIFDRVATAEMSAAPRHGSRKGLHSDQPAITQYLDGMVCMLWRHASLDDMTSGMIECNAAIYGRTYKEVAQACMLPRHPYHVPTFGRSADWLRITGSHCQNCHRGRPARHL